MSLSRDNGCAARCSPPRSRAGADACWHTTCWHLRTAWAHRSLGLTERLVISKTAMLADGRDSAEKERFATAPRSVLCERFVLAEELDYGRLGIFYKARDHLRSPGA